MVRDCDLPLAAMCRSGFVPFFVRAISVNCDTSNIAVSIFKYFERKNKEGDDLPERICALASLTVLFQRFVCASSSKILILRTFDDIFSTSASVSSVEIPTSSTKPF